MLRPTPGECEYVADVAAGGGGGEFGEDAHREALDPEFVVDDRLDHGGSRVFGEEHVADAREFDYHGIRPDAHVAVAAELDPESLDRRRGGWVTW